MSKRRGPHKERDWESATAIEGSSVVGARRTISIAHQPTQPTHAQKDLIVRNLRQTADEPTPNHVFIFIQIVFVVLTQYR